MSPTVIVAIITALGVAAAAGASYLAARFAAKQSAEANAATRDQQQENRMEDWNAGYRANGEEHLLWDVDRAGDITELRQIVNRLEVELGHKPTKFEPIPKPPPLFPRMTT